MSAQAQEPAQAGPVSGGYGQPGYGFDATQGLGGHPDAGAGLEPVDGDDD